MILCLGVVYFLRVGGGVSSQHNLRLGQSSASAIFFSCSNCALEDVVCRLGAHSQALLEYLELVLFSHKVHFLFIITIFFFITALFFIAILVFSGLIVPSVQEKFSHSCFFGIFGTSPSTPPPQHARMVQQASPSVCREVFTLYRQFLPHRVSALVLESHLSHLPDKDIITFLESLCEVNSTVECAPLCHSTVVTL